MVQVDATQRRVPFSNAIFFIVWKDYENVLQVTYLFIRIKMLLKMSQNILLSKKNMEVQESHI